MLDDTVSEHLEQMAEFSENWRKKFSPALESVERYSKGFAAQVDGLQPLIQKFSESLFEAKDKMSNTDQVVNVLENTENLKKKDKKDNEPPTENAQPLKQ